MTNSSHPRRRRALLQRVLLAALLLVPILVRTPSALGANTGPVTTDDVSAFYQPPGTGGSGL